MRCDQVAVPRVALTLGDVAGIGPEIVAACLVRWRARLDRTPDATPVFQPFVYGHPSIIERGFATIGRPCPPIVLMSQAGETARDSLGSLICCNPCRDEVLDVPVGRDDPRGGRAAAECLQAAIRDALRGDVDAIVTAPLSKKSLQLAGLPHPGHTEILAEMCGVHDHAMMLYLPHGGAVDSPCGLGVAHVTLHTSIASVPGLLKASQIAASIRLIGQFMRRIGCESPRIAVCALNPHAGEQGLFGDEEQTIIAPAVAQAQDELPWLRITGPLPADTLIRRAVRGEFDGLVAMYHDQGHIAFKLIGMDRAVNITLGLPIIRTSPSHGTAFDIAGQGVACPDGFQAAIDVALRLIRNGS